MYNHQRDKMPNGNKNGNGKWKEFDKFENIAEFRGYTKATLDNIQNTVDKMSDKFDRVHSKIDENEDCIAHNSTSIGKLQVGLKNIEKNAEKKGGIMGTVSGFAVSILAHVIQMLR